MSALDNYLIYQGNVYCVIKQVMPWLTHKYIYPLWNIYVIISLVGKNTSIAQTNKDTDTLPKG